MCPLNLEKAHYNKLEMERRVVEQLKSDLAEKLINKVMGDDSCAASKIRLARKYSLEQIKDLLYLVESFDK